MGQRVLVLNASYEPLQLISTRRAIVLLLQEKAELVEATEQRLRAQGFYLDIPLVIRLVRYIKIPRRMRLPCSRRGVLTRDRELLKRRDITHGCYVHALRSEAQLREVFDRLDLARSVRPFTRCLSCNAPLRPLDAAQAAPRVPPRVRAQHQRFVTCDGCGRIFWEGSHWRRMRTLVDAMLG